MKRQMCSSCLVVCLLFIGVSRQANGDILKYNLTPGRVVVYECVAREVSGPDLEHLAGGQWSCKIKMSFADGGKITLRVYDVVHPHSDILANSIDFDDLGCQLTVTMDGTGHISSPSEPKFVAVPKEGHLGDGTKDNVLRLKGALCNFSELILLDLCSIERSEGQSWRVHQKNWGFERGRLEVALPIDIVTIAGIDGAADEKIDIEGWRQTVNDEDKDSLALAPDVPSKRIENRLGITFDKDKGIIGRGKLVKTMEWNRRLAQENEVYVVMQSMEFVLLDE